MFTTSTRLVRTISARRFAPGLFAAVAAACLAVSACSRQADPPARAVSSFGAFVDDYLDQFARRHPSIAAGNGLHAHDGSLEDFSAGAIAAEIIWLKGVRNRLDAFDRSAGG
jgi:hypothetical protein